MSEETRSPASADSSARRQFQATGQPVSRTQAIDAKTPSCIILEERPECTVPSITLLLLLFSFLPTTN